MSAFPLPEPAPAASGRDVPRLGVLAYVRRVDWFLVVAVVGIAALSLDVIGHATASDGVALLQRQQAYFVVGGVGMAVATFVPLAVWRRLHWVWAGSAVSLLILVLVVGDSRRGGQRWITLPFFDLQPSELGKLALVLGLSALLANRRERVGSWVTTLLALLYVGVAAALVFAEPDLGTALVYAVAGASIMFLAGIRWLHFALLLLLAGAALFFVLSVLPGAGVEVIKPYQTQRLTSFLNPQSDPGNTGYNQNQARIAVGAGGLNGLGDQATQTQGNFLPENHTDFIFASLAEKRGFAGAATLLALYLVVLWRALRAATLSRTLYGTLVAGGVAMWLLFSVFVNVGMSIGLAPVTGIPLPLMSYGGSSVMVTLFALGVVQAVQLRGRLPEPVEPRPALPPRVR